MVSVDSRQRTRAVNTDSVFRPVFRTYITGCLGFRFLGDRLYKSSAVAEMGDRVHNRHRPRIWGAAVPVSRRAGTPSNTMWPGPRPTTIPSAILVHPVLGHNGHWPKIGGLCPFREGEAGSPSNTKSPGLRPTSIPNGILMHPAVWRQ